MTRRMTTVGLAVIITVLALAGCGPADQPRVATAQPPAGTGTSVSPSPVASETNYDKALRFTRCMGDHGVTLPDPVEGKMLVTGYFGPGIDVDAGMDAYATCKQYLPATWPVQQDPTDLKRDQPYFDCLRQHGIDAPVPDANGVTNEPVDGAWMLTPEYKAADAACRHLIDDPANNANQ